MHVATVTAWDADDSTSGTNARLTYSIEKNVVDEKSGQALFAVHPRSGELRTAICCLDRETTPEYKLQVVASDGGGLKGIIWDCFLNYPRKSFVSRGTNLITPSMPRLLKLMFTQTALIPYVIISVSDYISSQL